MTHVFVDESARSSYLLVATHVSSADLTAVRAAVRRLRLRGQERIHFCTESDRRRKTIIAALRDTAATVRVYESTGRQELARAADLTELINQIADLPARHLVLESRGVRDAIDRKVIHAALHKTGFELRYEHRESRHEPLLWISDAVGWAYGAGGDWARRVAPMIDRVTTLP